VRIGISGRRYKARRGVAVNGVHDHLDGRGRVPPSPAEAATRRCG